MSARAGQFWTAAHLLLLTTAALAQPDARQTGQQRSRPSAAGHYEVSFFSTLEPIAINRIHSWVVHIEDRNGAPVTDAHITVSGGMPEHDHGLPTSPRQTEYLDNGDYLIEGMRFHMNGVWEVVFTIQAAGLSDTVRFRVEL